MNCTRMPKIVLDKETIDGLKENDRGLILGDYASQLGQNGVSIVSEYYQESPAFVSKWKKEFESRILHIT